MAGEGRVRTALKALGLLLVLLLGLYALVVAGVFAAMRQPPHTFGRIMAKVPGPAFMVLPFKPLWMLARGGSLQVGQEAPDFTLETVDRSARVSLSSYRGDRPVVLVFGSYT